MALPRSRSYQAALKALTTVAEEESRQLCAVLESEDSTDEEREAALKALGKLARSLILRIADLEQTAEPSAPDLADLSPDLEAA